MVGLKGNLGSLSSRHIVNGYGRQWWDRDVKRESDIRVFV
jgi:hypothetical protein